ncbi:LysM peptidoglycan-binding domain-containing protein [Enterovibrio sp. ZSDZ42]|uniref:LysM peptidoglycan-binding domain-containing protein n=1 Tax=Enterovibrio gelatinilyticus TaxID=2899819 RepID=A0ABT5R5T7_9GAMM|nr:LysM peptidoglycan-binding domain-containing protein [Enterovibrio sp. ZSDZ42]MDD1795555.1 LysM peptidoglycan-binding domain-containing protein [Enterovibrio sp. ZSDZ42]
MFKKLITFCIAGLLSATAMAASIEVAKDAPSSYTVRKGDTLWDIAGIYLSNPWQWPKLWKQNPDIENPHLIYPGDVLRLNWASGKPTLSLSSGSRLVDQLPVSATSQSVFKQYLTFDTLISEAELSLAPRVLGSQEGWSYISKRTPFYIDASVETENWFVYRTVTKFERLDNEQIIRVFSLKKVAEAKLVRALDEMSEFKLVKQSQEVKPNDILLPALGEKTGNVFHPQAAPAALEGNLVGHLYGSKYVGLKQIVVVDRGAEDGVNAGHALSVQQPGATLKGTKGKMRYDSDIDNAVMAETTLPDQRVGVLLVIKSYPYFSLAMVVDAAQPLSAPMPVISVEG